MNLPEIRNKEMLDMRVRERRQKKRTKALAKDKSQVELSRTYSEGQTFRDNAAFPSASAFTSTSGL
jgi:hypothetical protein